MNFSQSSEGAGNEEGLQDSQHHMGVMMSRKNAFTWNSEHQSGQQALNNVMLPGP